MKRKALLILMSLLIVTGLAACGPSQAELDARATQIAANVFATQTAQAPTPTPTPTLTSTFTPTPKPTLTPTATLTPTPTPTPTPLTPADIFARVSPSIGFIETPGGTGSGVLIEDGYLVTNAHVVWPFQKVRVVFQDGSEYLDTPVLNWDLLADLAIIGPLQTSIAPLSFVDGEQQVIGSDVYLVGYPGEVEQFPQPTITRGLISRLREWESLEITYFQTDATIAGGQSGGVLVSKKGEVVGISGFAFTEAGFGMVASATDILPRIQKLIAGEDIAGLGDRFLPSAEQQFESDFTLHHRWERRVYIINEPARTAVDLTAEGKNNAVLAFEDMFGNLLISADEGKSGAETGSATTEWAVPHFVVIGQSTESVGEFHLRSNRGLILHGDMDDGVSVTIGQTVLGSMDYPGDLDYFTLELSEGDLINLTVDSIMLDPFLGVSYPEAADEQLVFDDDSGGGLFGSNAELTYRAPHSGSYFITIKDQRGYNIGGYTLKLAPPPPGATPVAPPPTPTPTGAVG
jgi:S1-C subfamily serine protease